MAKSAAALRIAGQRRNWRWRYLAKLERGVSFDHLAKRYSKCPSGRNGGDLGEFQQGAMVGPFRSSRLRLSAAQTLWPGENQIRLPHHQGAVSPLARDTMAP